MLKPCRRGTQAARTNRRVRECTKDVPRDNVISFLEFSHGTGFREERGGGGGDRGGAAWGILFCGSNLSDVWTDYKTRYLLVDSFAEPTGFIRFLFISFVSVVEPNGQTT